MNSPQSTSQLYALLIAVDGYLPNVLPDGVTYPSLSGCVRDVGHVEEFLRAHLGMTDEHIFKLTSTNRGSNPPPEPPEKLPTYENMVAAFQKITERAQPGDQVYLHFSGHGGRTKTKFPALKGDGGVDEALVPMDIRFDSARYLRDVEMAHLLKGMVDKGLVVTLVLDCCHSGGATRGKGAVKRGSNRVDPTPRPLESLVASDAELESTWRGLTRGATRNAVVGSGWLPQPQGYVLLAACRDNESAYEYPFDGSESNGALTYWLLDTLRQQLTSGPTYEQLHNRLLAKIHTQFQDQTPQLQGEGDRVAFGTDRVPVQPTVNVLQVDAAGGRVRLETGQALLTRKGAQFAVYRRGTTDFSQLDRRVAVVEVTELGATASWAKITGRFEANGALEDGSPAVQLNPGKIPIVHRVNLVGDHAILADVKRALQEKGGGWLEAADEGQIHFQVAVADETLEIWDPAGTPIPNLDPAIKTSERDAAALVVKRLVHLAKYQSVRLLDNADANSPLAGKLIVELAGRLPDDYDPADAPTPTPFDDPGATPTFAPGQWTLMRVKNASDKPLNIAILDLQPDWGIAQIFPQAQNFQVLDPGRELKLPLSTSLPGGYTRGADVIKVMAAVGPANFRVLELPALGRGSTRGARSGAGPSSPLDELLAAVAADQPKTRNVNTAVYPSKEWVTAQVELRVDTTLRDRPQPADGP